MSKHAELLESIMNGDEVKINDGQKTIEQQAKPEEQKAKVEEVIDDKIEIPEYVPTKQKGRAPEESVAILRKQRDEARKELEEKNTLLDTANKSGSIYDEVKKLIKKDDVTPDDLKQIFDDYDFTKKEKEALATQLKETQDKLRDYDIRQSPEFIASYERPLVEAQNALAAEIVPIVNGKPVTNQKAAQVIHELINDGEINAQTVKVALSKIRDAYEDAGVDYEVPSVRNVLSGINTVMKLHGDAGEAYKSWEQTKIQKQLEKEEMSESKSTLVKAQSRQDRKVIAKSYLADLVKSDNYDYIAEEHGHANVMNVAVEAHSELSDMMEDQSKAPTYDRLLDMATKAKLYDKIMVERSQSSKIVVFEAQKAKMEGLGNKSDKSAQPKNDNKDLLRSHGVEI